MNQKAINIVFLALKPLKHRIMTFSADLDCIIRATAILSHDYITLNN
ncbi:hypothetical protein AM1_6389 [Acaryochloris marina MBIC11017]|uniref:Uncharacterized protein n=1 Tax=Acaryochloris marina (strain MBIC 11017) TaxID=329726 RepID=B0C8Q7_ACAM1|nr:hypothetical protein AM1_6389 [Acaryochloris marina MBIC11017]